MQVKHCSGSLHPPGGALVPLSDFTFNKTGPRAGKPLYRCKYCRSSGNSKTVPFSVFMPIVEKLLENRTPAEVSKLTGLNYQLITDLKSGKRKRIYKNTFLKLNRVFSNLPNVKESIGPKSKKSQRNGLKKLSYEERLGLKQLISIEQKKRFKLERKLLKHVV